MNLFWDFYCYLIEDGYPVEIAEQEAFYDILECYGELENFFGYNKECDESEFAA